MSWFCEETRSIRRGEFGRRLSNRISGRFTRRLRWITPLGTGLLVGVFLLMPGSASVANSTDWPAYLFGNDHSSFNAAATAVSTSNVASLG